MGDKVLHQKRLDTTVWSKSKSSCKMVKIVQSHFLHLSSTDLENMFNEYDYDGDRLMNFEEFTSWMLESLFNECDSDGDKFVDGAEIWLVNGDQKAIDKFDKDGDGLMNLEEFNRFYLD